MRVSVGFSVEGGYTQYDARVLSVRCPHPHLLPEVERDLVRNAKLIPVDNHPRQLYLAAIPDLVHDSLTFFDRLLVKIFIDLDLEAIESEQGKHNYG